MELLTFAQSLSSLLEFTKKRDAIFEASYTGSFDVTGGKGEAAIVNHLRDHADHVSVR